jgi:MFS family permease
MTKRRVTLSFFLRIYLFFIITSVELIMNVGTGIISFASKRIKLELQMNDKEFSLFDSVNSFGRAFGSLTYMIISNKFDRQYTFLFFITIKGILLIIFNFTQKSLTLIILRFFIGIFHMPPSIYIPIWIDQYGIKKYKTVQLTIKTFSVPMGKVIGYLYCYFFSEINVK